MSAKILLSALHYFRMFISLIATHCSAKNIAKIIVQYNCITDK